MYAIRSYYDLKTYVPFETVLSDSNTIKLTIPSSTHFSIANLNLAGFFNFGIQKKIFCKLFSLLYFSNIVAVSLFDSILTTSHLNIEPIPFVI